MNKRLSTITATSIICEENDPQCFKGKSIDSLISEETRDAYYTGNCLSAICRQTMSKNGK
ncbi:hypothetical protein LOAG_01492 [Loa loa]|uniref:Uncharacterized protein n=1 Tax=Loa loa TaxID=7209 RepID=A0A1S0U992_LOALO|nr:hypothetical protein LOAG_01492 [Loa loa]EFO26996.1 hypothetical protein LOAG_01492 [Loa loa]